MFKLVFTLHIVNSEFRQMYGMCHCRFIQSFNALKNLFCFFIPLSPRTLVTANLFPVDMVLHFPECHIIGIIQYAAFSDWLLWLSKMHCFLHVFSWLCNAFFFFALKMTLSRCTTVYSSTEAHRGCFQLFSRMNKATINIHVWIVLETTLQLIWVNNKELNC